MMTGDAVLAAAGITVLYTSEMTPRRPLTAFRIDEDLKAGLQEVWERDGIPVSEQIRRAVRVWLEGKGVTTKTDRKRAVTRKRS